MLLAAAVWNLGASGSSTVVRAWFEPKSMRAPVTQALSGAKRTELAFGRLTDEGLEYLPQRALAVLGLSKDALLEAARVNASADLAGLKPRYARDRNKVIQYAELTSDRPLVASAVLAPGFRAVFKDTLGDNLLVVVPSRYTVFVFPKLASRYQEYYPMVFEAYRATAYPVSVEVFEFAPGSITAIGVFDEP